MKNVIQTILDSYNNACLVIKNKNVTDFNPPAKKLWPTLTAGVSLSELGFPELPAGNEASTVSVPLDTGRVVKMHITETEGVQLLLADSQGEPARAVDILSAACRQMREPLSTLSMAAGLLFPRVEAQEDDKLQSYMSIIYQSYYKLLRMVGNIALLQEMDTGIARLERNNLDIIALCRNLVDSTNHFIDDVQIEFHSNYETLIVGVDGQKIERMLLNLLANSIKYIQKDGKIRVSISTMGENLIFEVSDNGCGVPEQKLDTVFRGYTEKKDNHDPNKGLQMGLPIVEHIAALHGGFAIMSSKAGEGTTVQVSIPRRLADTEGVFDTVEPYQTIGITSLYAELSDVIPHKKYSTLYLD